MSTLDVVTFGCRLNAFESEVIRGQATAAGLSDAVIINTCAVTAEAERQARQAIRKARRARPGARIVVTGCAAQIDPARFAAMPEVDLVLGNAEKLRVESYGPDTNERVRAGDIMVLRETAAHMVDGLEGRARAFVEVQQGCDHRCTFCIIPFGRGPSRSVPLGAVAERVRALLAHGYREIVLTGVDLTSYGGDLPGRPTLGQAVRRLLATAPELGRLRLSSLDPVEIDDDLVALFGSEPRLMPHAHLSLQAGDDTILKRMKRRHSRAQAIEICGRLRSARPDIAFGADLIAGFPTETEAMFSRTLDLIADCDLTYLHVFPFSARPGTPAARMPALPMGERRARAERLRMSGKQALLRLLDAQLGRRVAALVESSRIGRTDHYAKVVFDHDATPGSVVDIDVLGRRDEVLVGRIAA